MALFPRNHAINTTYIDGFTRGLNGVNVSRDHLITQILLSSIGFVCVVVLFTRIAQIAHSHLRHVSTLAASRRQQRYWGLETSWLWTNLKKHVLYAPLGSKRHNREIKLSDAVNVGTLPSRFHMLLLTIYLSSQVAYCSLLNYSVNEKAALIAELRGRSGVLSVLNMIPLFLLAGRNNFLIRLLHVSFDTYNLIHRWLGRMVALEAIVHTCAWSANAISASDLSHAAERVRDDPFFLWGFVGTCAMTFLLLHSPSPIRHAFYEVFLHLHQMAAFLALVGVYIHIDLDKLPQKPWVLLVIAIWVFDRSARLARLIYLNISLRKGMTKVVVQALAGEACRVTFHLPRRVHVPAGSHVYAYLPCVALWMSHPFSVAWVEPSSCSTQQDEYNSADSVTKSEPSRLEKGDFEGLDFAHDVNRQPTSVSLIISARTGMTRALYNKASACPNQTLHTAGLIEGPYGSHPSTFGSYGTVVMFSAGVGITHHMVHVRDLLLRAAEGTVATQCIYLVWSVRSTEHLVWVREYMDQILQLPNRRELLVIKLFVSKPKSSREISSPSETVQMFPGRCKADIVMDEVLPKRVGATVVSVCGPGAFADDVRNAARSRIGQGAAIDFVEEAFTW